MRNHKRAALAAAPLSLALLLAACGSDDDSADDATTTTIEATTTSSSETTAPPSSETTAPPPSEPAPGDTEPVGDGGLPETTEEWATELVRAWGAGDRDRAGQLATPEVVDQLFGHADPGGDDWEATGCEGAAGTLYCTFASASRSETLLTRQANMPDEGTGQLPPIAQVEISPNEVDEEVLGAQSDPLIRAWGAGDRAEATVYAHPEVVDALFDLHDPGGPDWDRRDCLVVSGDPQCIYYDPGRDQRVIIHFDPTALPTDVVITEVEPRDGASG